MDYSKLIEPDEVTDKPYIFVSYSRKDQACVQTVLKLMRLNHFRFWYDKGLKSGIEWAEELGEKIVQCDQFLVLISPNSVKSKFVKKEIGLAIDKDKNILVVYLEETKLSAGLQLDLGDIQAINKSLFGDDSGFEKELCKSLSNSTLYQSSSVFDYSESEPVSGSAELLDAKSQLLENYEIRGQIGAGGMSEVFLAIHKRTGAFAVVKHGIIDSSYGGEAIKLCFLEEKNTLIQLMNKMCPFTPTMMDYFEDNKQIFIVESWINGKSLEKCTPFSEDEVVEITKKVLNILRYIHDSNIIHRDIKPFNLIKDEYGVIHLIDFNTAMTVENGKGENNNLIGTIGFAPPEQYHEYELLSYATDIYALGRTVTYLLCPEQFDRNTQFPVRYYRRDISVQLEAIINKMTDPSQIERYQNTEEVLKDLESYRKVSLWKKVKLLIESNKRIRSFASKSKQTDNTKKRILQEMADASDSDKRDEAVETVFLTESEEDISSTQ